MSVILVFGVTFTILMFISMFRRRNIPGPFSLPVIGNYLQIKSMMRGNYDENMNNLAKKYGNIFQLFYGDYRVVYIYGYDLIHDTFVKNGHIFSHRPNWLPGVQLRMQNGSYGVIWSNGEQWKNMRRLITKSMRDFGVGKKILEDAILDEVNLIAKQLQDADEKPITDLIYSFVRAAGNIVHQIVFGFKHKHDEPKFRKMMASLKAVSEEEPLFSPSITFPRWFTSIKLKLFPGKFKVVKAVIGYILEQIKEHQETFDANNIRDFTDLYITMGDGNKNSTEKDSRVTDLFRVLFDLFVAGTDTTGTSMEWQIIYMLAYPEVQEKCYTEIEKVIGVHRSVLYQDKSNLVYVEATMLEIQRLSNTLSFTIAHQANENTMIGNYYIPKDTIVIGSLYSAHHDEKYWHKPTEFRPERFIDENGKICKRDLVLAFSLGPRSCVGEPIAKMELFLTFANLIKCFKFVKANEAEVVNLEGTSGAIRKPHPFQFRAIAR